MRTVKLEIQESDLAPTEWDDVKSKVRFAKQFAKFITGGFKCEDFPKWFYTRLSMCFGHIAHYNQSGFYEHFFSDDNGKIAFIRQSLLHPCYGDPKFVFSDVEHILKKWLEDSQVLEQIHLEANKSRVNAERDTLRRLIEKYGDDNTEQVLEMLDFQVEARV